MRKYTEGNLQRHRHVVLNLVVRLASVPEGPELLLRGLIQQYTLPDLLVEMPTLIPIPRKTRLS